MPDPFSLLPSSSTQLERALATSTDWLPRLDQAGNLIRTSKRVNIPDAVVPWLIYEYGLGELLPYLKDPRTAISTGVLWQRLRGTPESFRIALSWIGNDGSIEESEENTIRWAQYQLGLAQAPDDLSQTDSVVELSRLSSPVRSSLFRIYGGWYDGRRFKLDEHKLSSFDPLCDHTGVYLKPEWPQLSFGRLTEQLFSYTGDEARVSVHRFVPSELLYEDRFILDQSKLDEWWHLLEQMQMSHTRITFILEQPKPARPSTTWIDSPQQTWNTALAWDTSFKGHKLEFAKAGIYLGDGALLGETNACLPAYAEVEVGDGPLLLSEFDPQSPETQSLSGHVLTWRRQEINERFDREHDGGTTAYVPQPNEYANDRQHFVEDQAVPVTAASSAHRRTVDETTLPQDGTTWASDRTWEQQNGWLPLFQGYTNDRRHVVEVAGGTSAIESKLDRTFSGSHAAPAVAIILDEANLVTGESVLDEEPTRDTVTIHESYSRRHTDVFAAPGVNVTTAWAGSDWQSAGDWLGTFLDNHIWSRHSTVDSVEAAPVLAFNPTAEYGLERERGSALDSSGSLGVYSLHRTHTDEADITTSGEIWALLGTWADVTTWAAGANQATSASRTHHVVELTHSGVTAISGQTSFTGPAPVDRVETLFTHPDYFANPETWASAGISWAEGAAWTPVLAGRARAHAVESDLAPTAESTNHASNVVPVSETVYLFISAESARTRGRSSRAFVPFFRGEVDWLSETWGSVYGWTEFEPPASGHTRLRLHESLPSLPAETVDTGRIRLSTFEQFPDDRFVLDELSTLDEHQHRASDPMFITTVRTSTAYYPQNASGWSTTLPWAGVWAWFDDFGEPLSHHSRSAE